MEKVQHLLNVIKLFGTVGCASNNLMTHYVERCKKISNNLPTNIFGPSAMCSHCWSPWSYVEHRARVLPGRMPSKAISKLIRKSQENEEKVPRSRRTLIKKCLSNRKNKIMFKCSVCSKDTRIYLKKQIRPKPVDVEASHATLAQSTKKKKKRVDRTAGLIIPGMRTPHLQSSAKKGMVNAKKKNSKNFVKTVVPQLKPKKTNKSRLQSMLKKSASSKSALHSFIKELS